MDRLYVCVDASFLIRLLESEEGRLPMRLWQEWHRKGCQIVAPTLLYYEVSNALYRYVAVGDITVEQAQAGLDALLNLNIALVGDPALHLRALHLARELGLRATYDAHYLALTERLGAEFWTADRRLFETVHRRMPDIHLLETEEP